MRNNEIKIKIRYDNNNVKTTHDKVNFTDEELEYASKCAFEHISRNCTPVDKPIAIFIGIFANSIKFDNTILLIVFDNIFNHYAALILILAYCTFNPVK